MMKPVDTHAHIDWLDNPDAAFDRAKDAGLGLIVGVGVDLDSNKKILEISRKHPDLIRPALGAHPWMVKPDYHDNVDFIGENLNRCCALGEVGLDYKVKVDKKLQQRVLAEVIEIAAQFKKPVLLHARYSQERCLNMLKSAGIETAVFHWYSGPLDILDRVLEAGFRISATPALAYSPPHRAALERAPLDQILVETDCPEEYQGKKSEPADLIRTIHLLAELKDKTVEEIEDATTKNAVEFFGWNEMPFTSS